MRGSPTDSTLAVLATGIMCAASIGCLVGGVIYFQMSTEGRREHLVGAYEAAVRDWPQARGAFGGLAPAARLGPNGSEEVLEANSTLDELQDVHGPLPSYEALAFRALGLPSGAAPVVELHDMQAVAPASPAQDREAESPRLGLAVRLGGALLAAEAFPLVRARVRHRSGTAGTRPHCDPRTGVRIGGECWAFERVERLCVQVAPGGTEGGAGAWHLAPRSPGRNYSYGCDFAGGDWVVPVYRHLDVGALPLGADQWPSGPVRFDDLVVEVRSSADPHLRALELTHGTLDFGMSAEEEDVLGVVLMVLSFGFSCPLICLITRCWCRSSRDPRLKRRRPVNWKYKGPDPETVGMRHAVDAADRQLASAENLERAIEGATRAGGWAKDPGEK